MSEKEKERIGNVIVAENKDRTDMSAYDDMRIYCNQVFINRVCSDDFSIESIKKLMTISRHKNKKGVYYGLAGIIEDGSVHGTATVYCLDGKRLLTYDMINELAEGVKESNYEKIEDNIEYIKNKCNYDLKIPKEYIEGLEKK